MCQVQAGAYVPLLTPGETQYSDCHRRKTTTYILHVVSITPHTHDRHKSIGEKKTEKRKEDKGKERRRTKQNEQKKAKRRRQEKQEKTRQESKEKRRIEQKKKEKEKKRKERKNVILADPRNWLRMALS